MNHFLLIGFVFNILFIFNNSFAQNLIPNPSFEGDINKPSFRPWLSINIVDFFVYRESKVDQKIRIKPARFLGFSIFERTIIYWYDLTPARTGVAYVGMRFWPKHYEFIVIELKEQLKAEISYFFEMHIKSSKNTNSYLKEIGVAFYSYVPPYQRTFAIKDYPPQLRIINPSGFRSTDDWEVIRGVYTAEGGEKFVIIGDFELNDKIRFLRKNFSLKIREAYYFIDDIGLFLLDENGWPIRDIGQ